MAASQPSLLRAAMAAWQLSSEGVTALWLMFVYLLTMLLVLLTLSAFQVRDKISNFREGDTVYSVGEMVRLLDTWDRRRAALDNANRQISLIRQHLITVEGEIEELLTSTDKAWSSHVEGKKQNPASAFGRRETGDSLVRRRPPGQVRQHSFTTSRKARRQARHQGILRQGDFAS